MPRPPAAFPPASPSMPAADTAKLLDFQTEVARALDKLAKPSAGPGAAFMAAIARLGVRGAWEAAAEQCAEVGLLGASPSRATHLLVDLMPYPQMSRARHPQEHANVNWHAHCAYFHGELCKEHGLRDHFGAAASSATPYPPLFAPARVAALARLGADPRRSKALLRAVFRKSVEEIEAVLSIPGCPPTGECPPGAGSPLHRACYAGPGEAFAALARASLPADWRSLDKEGKRPLEKAEQSGAAARAEVARKLTLPQDPAPRVRSGHGV